MQNKIEQLRNKLNLLNYKYYVEANPEVSDYEYDQLLRQLQQLEAEYPQFFDPNSPTQRVGSDLANSFNSVEHRYPMLSLSNTYSLEELHDFVARIEREEGESEFVCELKFDGTAISIIYENGRLLIYYASSDTRLHVAETTVEKLVDYCINTPADPLRSVDCVKQRCALIAKNLHKPIAIFTPS